MAPPFASCQVRNIGVSLLCHFLNKLNFKTSCFHFEMYFQIYSSHLKPHFFYPIPLQWPIHLQDCEPTPVHPSWLQKRQNDANSGTVSRHSVQRGASSWRNAMLPLLLCHLPHPSTSNSHSSYHSRATRYKLGTVQTLFLSFLFSVLLFHNLSLFSCCVLLPPPITISIFLSELPWRLHS